MSEFEPPPDPLDMPPADSAAAADAAAAVIEELEKIVGELEERIDLLERRDWCPWPTASPTVVAWVTEWLRPTFGMNELPKDWQDDAAMVSELTALYAGYRQMTKTKSSGWDPLTWHGHLHSTRARIKEVKSRRGADVIGRQGPRS